MQGPVGGLIYAVSDATIFGATDVLVLVVSNEGRERTCIPPVQRVSRSVGIAKRRAPASRHHSLEEYNNGSDQSIAGNVSIVGDVMQCDMQWGIESLEK